MIGGDVNMAKAVSIHAPVKGATNVVKDVQAGNTSFNPRAREGRDVIHFDVWRLEMKFQSTRP